MITRALASVLVDNILETRRADSEWLPSRADLERIAAEIITDIKEMGWLWPGAVAEERKEAYDAGMRAECVAWERRHLVCDEDFDALKTRVEKLERQLIRGRAP